MKKRETPLNPVDIREQQKKRVEKDGAPIIAAVNKALKEGCVNGTNIATDVMGKDPLVRAAIVSQFEKMGWDVTLHGDQRDGDYYTFRARS